MIKLLYKLSVCNQVLAIEELLWKQGVVFAAPVHCIAFIKEAFVFLIFFAAALEAVLSQVEIVHFVYSVLRRNCLLLGVIVSMNG